MQNIKQIIFKHSIMISLSFILLFLALTNCYLGLYLNKTDVFETLAIVGVKSTVQIEVLGGAGPGVGSGIVISQDGYIVTNEHVVTDATSIHAILLNGDRHKAKIIGTDPRTDLALLKIDGVVLIPFKLGDSDQIQIGSWVMAIGHPFGLINSITIGVVSGVDRSIGVGYYDMLIQTDAVTNPGNSGGPLINLKGEVIGLNTAIWTKKIGNTNLSMMGFAIPINMVKDITARLRKDGKVIRSSFGVTIKRISYKLQEKFKLKDRKGLLIRNIAKDSAAEKWGIKRGDVVISFNGKELDGNVSKFSYRVSLTPAGEKIKIIVIRDGKEKELTVELQKMKDPAKPKKIKIKKE